MGDETAAFDAFEADGPVLRFHFSWGALRSTYRLQFEGDGPLASPDPALAFRVGLALAPYFFSFLTPDRLHLRAGALDDDEAARWERWYTHGLAEKCFRQGLDPGTRIVR